MSGHEVNAAEGAIYALSAAGFLFLIVAAFFVWRALPQRHAGGNGSLNAGRDGGE